MAKVSIIVPVYNTERYLAECIDSVQSQSVSDWELILVDDGSDDLSGEICDRYASTDRRIRCIHQSNKGLSASRNAAIDVATGDYYFFIDSDDAIHPRAIERLLKAIDSAPGVMVAAGAYHYAAKKHFKESARQQTEIIHAERLIKDVLYQKKGTDNSVCWKLFDRRLFEGLRFYNGWFEDLDIFYRLYQRSGRIAIINDDIYFYRRHKSSFINHWSDGRRDILRVTDRMYDYISGHMPRLLQAVDHRRFSACYNLLMVMPDRNGHDFETCLNDIKRLRFQIITDPDSRSKNRLGAALSYIGLKLLKTISKWGSKY